MIAGLCSCSINICYEMILPDNFSHYGSIVFFCQCHNKKYILQLTLNTWPLTDIVITRNMSNEMEGGGYCDGASRSCSLFLSFPRRLYKFMDTPLFYYESHYRCKQTEISLMKKILSKVQFLNNTNNKIKNIF